MYFSPCTAASVVDGYPAADIHMGYEEGTSSLSATCRGVFFYIFTCEIFFQ